MENNVALKLLKKKKNHEVTQGSKNKFPDAHR